MCLPASARQPSLCANTLSSMQSPVSSEGRNYFKLLPSKRIDGLFHFLAFDLTYSASRGVIAATEMANNKSQSCSQTVAFSSFVCIFYIALELK